MKNFLGIIVLIIVVAAASIGGYIYITHSNTSNDSAQADKNGRYLTVVNHTNQIINEVHVTVGSGTEIEAMKQTNPDAGSLSIEIPKECAAYDTFTVTLIDRDGIKYQKEVTSVEKKGRTEVEFTQENYVKSEGDFFRKINKAFNGNS